MNRLSVQAWCGVTGSLLIFLAIVVGVGLWVPTDEVEAKAIAIEEGIFAAGNPAGSSDLFLAVPGIPSLNQNPKLRLSLRQS